MNCAVIDVGSNTIRLCIYQWKDAKLKKIFSKKETVGLAGYIHQRLMSEEGIRRCLSVLQEFAETTELFCAQPPRIFATASLRQADNADEVIRRVRVQTGLEIDLLSGKEEALLDFAGATRAVQMDEGVLTDIGGGSIEIVRFRQGEIMLAESLDVGSLSLYNRYVSGIFPDKEERRRIREAVEKRLETLSGAEGEKVKEMCGVGGTIRNACKLYNQIYGLPKENRCVPADGIREILKIYKNPGKTDLQMLLKVAPDRVHTLIPGMLALKEILRWYDVQTIRISDYGLREGYLMEKVLPSAPQGDEDESGE